MSDVADILGFGGKTSVAATPSEEATKIMGEKAKSTNLKYVKKPKGMRREIYDLIGTDSMVPAIQGNVLVPNFKNKRANALKGKWLWAPIVNSSGKDREPVLFHWIKADNDYNSNPYSKFVVKIDAFEYTDLEYEAFLQDVDWSKEDTNELVDICHRYDLRWPIIYDRIRLSKDRPLEIMQARYYTIRSLLKVKRNNGDTIEGSERFGGFELQHEAKRRKLQDALFRKTKEDELEEIRLRDELKSVEIALKKNKKLAKSTAPATAQITVKGNISSNCLTNDDRTSATSSSSSITTANMNIGNGNVVQTVIRNKFPANQSILNSFNNNNVGGSAATVSSGDNSAIAATAAAVVLGPVPGRPCLQSTRLFGHSSIATAVVAGGGGIIGGTTSSSNSGTDTAGSYGITSSNNNVDSATQLSKATLKKMCTYLRELDIPECPLPTRAVCDLVDHIKRNTIILMSIHAAVVKKEKQLATMLTAASTAVTNNTTAVGSGQNGYSVMTAAAAVNNKVKQEDGSVYNHSMTNMTNSVPATTTTTSRKTGSAGSTHKKAASATSITAAAAMNNYNKLSVPHSNSNAMTAQLNAAIAPISTCFPVVQSTLAANNTVMYNNNAVAVTMNINNSSNPMNINSSNTMYHNNNTSNTTNVSNVTNTMYNNNTIHSNNVANTMHSNIVTSTDTIAVTMNNTVLPTTTNNL